MSGHRHAASVLYGVSAQDQEAVLGSLPPADQGILRAHLLELRTLGFDAAAVRAATASLPAAPTPPSGPAQRLRAADAGAMQALLAHEPAGLLADVLAIESWPWSAPLLATLPAARKVELRLLAGRAAPTAALSALLLAQCDARLAAMPAVAVAQADDSAAAPRRTWFGKWLAWTR